MDCTKSRSVPPGTLWKTRRCDVVNFNTSWVHATMNSRWPGHWAQIIAVLLHHLLVWFIPSVVYTPYGLRAVTKTLDLDVGTGMGWDQSKFGKAA